MKRILVIDDDALIRDMIAMILQDAGYEVVGADDGRAGLDRYAEGGFDLVLLDIFMPGLDGLDALEELDPQEGGVPVVAMSGSGSDSGADPLTLAETLGATRTLEKGFAPEELVALVRELLGD